MPISRHDSHPLMSLFYSTQGSRMPSAKQVSYWQSSQSHNINVSQIYHAEKSKVQCSVYLELCLDESKWKWLIRTYTQCNGTSCELLVHHISEPKLQVFYSLHMHVYMLHSYHRHMHRCLLINFITLHTGCYHRAMPCDAVTHTFPFNSWVLMVTIPAPLHRTTKASTNRMPPSPLALLLPCWRSLNMIVHAFTKYRSYKFIRTDKCRAGVSHTMKLYKCCMKCGTINKASV